MESMTRSCPLWALPPWTIPSTLFWWRWTPPPQRRAITSPAASWPPPTVRGVLEDILPYLNVARDYTGVDMSSVEVEMPALAGMTEQEAKEALQEESLTYELIGSGTAVTGQIPQAGAKLPGNSEVILYMGEEVPSDMVTVPDFTGMTIGQANQAAANAGLYILVKGATEDSGYVTATGQDVEAGTSVVRGSTIRWTLWTTRPKTK